MINQTPQLEELGWISIQRKILYGNICPKGRFSRFEAWIYILLTANHQDATWQGITIKRGSFITSQLKLSEKFTWSLGQTNKFLYWLKSENRIEIQTTNRYSVITILNYNTYQRNESESENKVKTERKQSENKVKQTIMSNNNNNENNNKIAPIGANINSLLSKFKNVNPSYERMYANRTQRSALERMVIKYGEKKMSNLLDHLQEIISRPYAPQITTPYELEAKMGRLVQFLKQDQLKIARTGTTKI